jgi:hypothetical protein
MIPVYEFALLNLIQIDGILASLIDGRGLSAECFTRHYSVGFPPLGCVAQVADVCKKRRGP